MARRAARIALAAGLIGLAVGGLPTVAADADEVPGPALITWSDPGGTEELGAPPRAIQLSGDAPVAELVAGSRFIAARSTDGRVQVWQQQEGFPVPSLDELEGLHVVSLAAHQFDLMAATSDGHVRSWGLNSLSNAFAPPAELADKTVVQVGLGQSTAVARTSDGQVVVWGRTAEGQTGHPLAAVPEEVRQGDAVDLSVTDDTAAVLLSTGEVVEWGAHIIAFPPAPDGDPYTQISIGACVLLGLTTSGRVVQGSRCAFDAVPDSLVGQRVARVATNTESALALTQDGHVAEWGFTGEGRPVPLSLAGRTATAVASGWGYDVAAALPRLDQPAATITGTPSSGSTLTAGSSSTPVATTAAYQWLRDGDPVDGATGPTYVVAPADGGHRLSVRARLDREGLDGATVESATVTVPLNRMDVTGGYLTIRGGSVVGDLIDADAGLVDAPPGTVTSWSWTRDGRHIAGSTSQHRLTLADRGHRLSVTAVFSAPGYVPETDTAVATDEVRVPARHLGLRTDRSRVRRGQLFRVALGRLAGGEAYRIRLAGRTLASGHAGADGTVVRAVRMPSLALGIHHLTVVGWQSDRSAGLNLRTLHR